MKDKNGTAPAAYSDLTARIESSLTKLQQVRGFL